MASTAPRTDSPSLPGGFVEEAVRPNGDTAGRSEAELRHAVREAWIEEDREAIEGWNAWTEKHGLPLAGYQQL